MSMRLNMSKKKSQEEMRRLMAERKNKDINPTKINNPLAKYNSAGQLMCLLCSSVVRSENVWQVHINSKQHRDNIEKAKQLKELTNNFTVSNKKRSLSQDGPPEKKIKSILKNSGDIPSVVPQKHNNDASHIVSFHNDEIEKTPVSNILELADKEVQEETSKEQIPEPPIPEGFFDDPILDAKVRNIEYKDPIEEEWEKFQKEIKEEATASAEIIAEEQEEATAERQIDEIDEQIRNWSRVLDMELKKEETKKKQNANDQMQEDKDDSDNEEDIDEFLDWRAKKSYS